MKSGRKALGLILTAVLIATVSITATSQSKKKSQVKVKVISSEGDKVVEMDTTFNHDVFVFSSGDKTKVINLDSIMEAHHHDIDKHMRVMAFKMDSLNEFNFDFDGNMTEIHEEMERIMKEKGIEWKEFEDMHKEHGNRIMIMQNGENEFDIEEFINEDGDHIKIIKKEIHESSDHEPGTRTYVITSDSHDKPMHWKEKHAHKTTVSVESIPLEDIAFLKKIGLSQKKIMSEQIKLEELQVKIEKIIEDEKLQTLMHIECELPEGTYHLEMFNQEGNKVKEEKEIKAGPMKQEFELKKEEAPYYLILSKNNQFFGRKVVL